MSFYTAKSVVPIDTAASTEKTQIQKLIFIENMRSIIWLH